MFTFGAIFCQKKRTQISRLGMKLHRSMCMHERHVLNLPLFPSFYPSPAVALLTCRFVFSDSKGNKLTLFPSSPMQMREVEWLWQTCVKSRKNWVRKKLVNWFCFGDHLINFLRQGVTVFSSNINTAASAKPIIKNSKPFFGINGFVIAPKASLPALLELWKFREKPPFLHH